MGENINYENKAVTWTIIIFMVPFLIMMGFIRFGNKYIKEGIGSETYYLVLVGSIILVLLLLLPKVLTAMNIPISLKLITIIGIEILYSYLLIIAVAILVVLTLDKSENPNIYTKIIVENLYLVLVSLSIILWKLSGLFARKRKMYHNFFRIKSLMEKEFDLTYLATTIAIIVTLFKSTDNGVEGADLVLSYVTSATFALFTIKHALRRLKTGYKTKFKNIEGEINS